VKEAVELQFQNINYTFEGEERPSLYDISFAIKQGEWVSIIGPSGSGKTILSHLIAGMVQVDEGVNQTSGIWVKGKKRTSNEVEIDHSIGIVLQDPDAQIIQAIVEDELAFGPENLLIEPADINDRIDSALTEVGLTAYRLHRTNQLSGGQKQRIAIASVLTMKPDILLFDDAIASLDRPAAEQFRETLMKLHSQGLTIINVSTRLDQLDVGQADRLIVLHKGRIIADGSAEYVLELHKEQLVEFGCISGDLSGDLAVDKHHETSNRVIESNEIPMLEISGLSFQYPSVRHQNTSEVRIINDINYKMYAGEFIAIVGANGSGKTTLGKLIAGLLPAPKGSILLHGRDQTTYLAKELAKIIGYVFQNPEHQFIADTVIEECVLNLKISQGLQPWQKTPASIQAEGERILEEFGLLEYQQKHPFVLSTGQQRLLSVASTVLLEPDLIILDEPTAGQDYQSMARLTAWCKSYIMRGKSILMITHDLDYVEHSVTGIWRL
jgi:energy-coupling factor transporter ATP-binding protein EcfA2